MEVEKLTVDNEETNKEGRSSLVSDRGKGEGGLSLNEF